MFFWMLRNGLAIVTWSEAERLSDQSVLSISASETVAEFAKTPNQVTRPSRDPAAYSRSDRLCNDVATRLSPSFPVSWVRSRRSLVSIGAAADDDTRS